MKLRIKALLPYILGIVPSFKGKGRITLLLDAILTDYQDLHSYQVTGTLNGGIKFEFDLRPWGQKFAYYYREWEEEYVDVLRRIYAGGIFLDVGSSLGLYVVSLGEAVRTKGGSIISVEPVPFNLDRQKRNVSLNGFDDLVCYFHLALGREKSKARIYADPLGADNNAFITEDGELEIDILPLDHLVIERAVERIGLMKIDVEGYEPLVIEGAAVTIRQDLPLIFAEFCRERMQINELTIDRSWHFLTNELEYRCYVFDPKTKKLRFLSSPGVSENLFFIPKHSSIPRDLLS
ncbi:MAG: FkbM family methyltransferase [Blastocatellia bacterium]